MNQYSIGLVIATLLALPAGASAQVQVKKGSRNSGTSVHGSGSTPGGSRGVEQNGSGPSPQLKSDLAEVHAAPDYQPKRVRVQRAVAAEPATVVAAIADDQKASTVATSPAVDSNLCNQDEFDDPVKAIERAEARMKEWSGCRRFWWATIKYVVQERSPRTAGKIAARLCRWSVLGESFEDIAERTSTTRTAVRNSLRRLRDELDDLPEIQKCWNEQVTEHQSASGSVTSAKRWR